MTQTLTPAVAPAAAPKERKKITMGRVLSWTVLALVSAAWMLGRPWLVAGSLAASAVLAVAAFGLGSRAGNGSLA